MTLTTAVLIACALAFATKAIGYAIPPRLVEGERTMRVSTLLPAALLAGLIVVQTAADGRAMDLALWAFEHEVPAPELARALGPDGAPLQEALGG